MIAHVLASLVLALWLTPARAAATELRLTGATTAADAWPAMRVLFDEAAQLDTASALASLARFQAPDTPHGNLGPRSGAVWVHVPVQVAADAPPAWMLRLQYALLHRVEVKVYAAGGRLIHAATLGSSIAHAQREQPTRALATLVHFEPGRRHDVLLRIESPTALLVPLAFMQPGALAVEESQEVSLQGFMSGIWFFMAVYSLLNGLYHREASFVAYALSVASSWLFAQALFGVGAMQLWRDSAWLSANLSALAPLVMVPANCAFFISTLGLRETEPRLRRLLLAIGIASATFAVAFSAGWIGYRTAAAASMLLSISGLLLVLPSIFRRVRSSDRPALFLLMGVLANLTGVALITTLLRGALPFNNFLTMHGAQAFFATEMLMWLLVLAERLEQLRSSAQAARHEHAVLHALAHTDELTGLLNRRGLELALHERLQLSLGFRPSAEARQYAVFLLDLDGFKPVNDRWGHEAGDVLLRQVAKRLARAVRPSDLVARLGGDEFVVAVGDLTDEATAETIGRKLLAVFGTPFDLGDGRRADIGATIGYAMTGQHGRQAAHLLRQADRAMYAGKQAGKRKLVPALAD